MKAKSLILPGLIAVLVGAPIILAFGHQVSQAKTAIHPAIEIQTTHPERTTLESDTTITGTLVPYARAKLYAKVAGYLKTINVDKGDHVHAGELLAVLDVPELASQLAAAHSNTMEARAKLAQTQAALEKASSARDLAKLEYVRLHGARKQSPDLIAPMEEDEAKAKFAEASAEVATTRSDVAAAQADVVSKESSERQLQDQVDYTRITAPFDGVVSARFLDPGAMVQAGVASSQQAQPVVELVDAQKLRLDVQVPEAQVPFVNAGTPVTVTLPSVAGATREAKIVRTSLAEDLSTRTMLAEAEIANTDLAWHPGMYAQVTFHLPAHPGALMVPDQAVTRTEDKAYAYVVGADGKLHKREVKLGSDDGIKVQVVSGLSEADEVALNGPDPLHDGMEVRHG